MQITPATARSMGYHGSPKGLLDPETNLAFAAPYLANAWALADGDMDRAVRLYASGYYYTAKSKGMLGLMRNADSPPATPPKPETTLAAAPPPPPPPPQNILDSLFRDRASKGPYLFRPLCPPAGAAFRTRFASAKIMRPISSSVGLRTRVGRIGGVAIFFSPRKPPPLASTSLCRAKGSSDRVSSTDCRRLIRRAAAPPSRNQIARRRAHFLFQIGDGSLENYGRSLAPQGRRPPIHDPCS